MRSPNTPTVAELVPELDIALWNGLFVRKEVPALVRAKIRKVAMRVMTSDKARKLAEETGALIYWQDVDQAYAQIKKDIVSVRRISEILE